MIVGAVVLLPILGLTGTCITVGLLLDVPISSEESEYLQTKQKQKIEKTDDGMKISCSQQFEEHFYDVQSKQDRNLAIINTYLDGYTQAAIAEYLGVSKSLI